MDDLPLKNGDFPWLCWFTREHPRNPHGFDPDGQMDDLSNVSIVFVGTLW